MFLPILKAIYAAAGAAIGSFATAYAVNPHVGYQAIIAIVLTSLSTGFATWGVPNLSKPPAAK